MPLYVAAISRGCTSASAFNDLGTLLAQGGQIPSAVVQFELACSLEPSSRETRRNLCTALELMGVAALQGNRVDDAAVAYTRIADLEADSPVAQQNAGLAQLRARATARALPFLRRAAMLEPRSSTAHQNLGSVLFLLGQREAEAAFCRAIELDSGNVDAHVNLAAVYNRLGQLSRANTSLRQALHLAPDHAEAHAGLAGLLREQGEVALSIEHYRRALGLRPDSPEIFSNYLLARQGDPTAGGDDLVFEHRAWAARFADPLGPGPGRDHRNAGDDGEERPLRVGYVSADLRNHAVASFIEPIIGAHDRARVHVTCYSDAVPDLVTARIQTVARPDVWRDVRELTDEALARRIVADEIDVLVDLGGHTAGNRLLVFARRPAPVQITYCGYPGTTGLSAMDWRLTDTAADPEGAADRQHAERLWRLPHGFLCFQPDPEFGPVAPVPSLERGLVTFGSFNNLSKIGDEVLRCWAEILRQVSGSRLFLKARALSDEEPRQRLRAMMDRHGVDPARVEFAPYAASSAEHVSLYRRVDVALDPFPYNGTTTTCEAIWMGVPVITLAGQTHAGRVGASLLTGLGCPELVADTVEDYVATAAALAHAPLRLAGYRADLRGRMSAAPLTKSTTIAHDLEDAYKEMWRRRR